MVNFAVVAGLVMAYLLPSPTLSTPIFDMAEGSWGGVGTPVRLTLREWKENDLYSSKGNTWLASSSPPGEPGSLVVGYKQGKYPFYVQFGQLYQAQNSTHVLYANVVNVTDSSNTEIASGHVAQIPIGIGRSRETIHTRVPNFRVKLGKTRQGLPGTWIWNEYEGALQYQTRTKDRLQGNFYTCADRETGHSAIFLDLDESMTYPVSCTAIKLVQ